MSPYFYTEASMIPFFDLADATNVIRDIHRQFEVILTQVEKILKPYELNLYYEDIYNQIFRIIESGLTRLIVRYKWRRLSLLIDYLLYLTYLKSYTQMPLVCESRHVRGSRRSDL